MNSEVARIRQQIALEYEAANRVFKEPAIASSHQSIEARQVRLADYFEELATHMSREEAVVIFVEASGGADNE